LPPRILSTPSAGNGNFPIASMLRRIHRIPGQSLPKITFSVSRSSSGKYVITVPAVGMGTQSVGFVVNNAVIGHAFSHCGEISALKGVQGKKGCPF
jgi:hypothetical protein